jgi:hypothetical protein
MEIPYSVKKQILYTYEKNIYDTILIFNTAY